MTSQTANDDLERPLVTRCVLGEEQAWRELHRAYYPVAFRFLRRMGIPAGDLDDACQEVFVQVFRYLARFEQRAEFRTWLYRLCLSQAGRVRRRRHIREALDWLLGHRLSGEAACEPEWSASMVAQRVAHALDRMKPIHRTALVLFEFEGLDGEEMARILRCPPATIRRRLHYARKEFEALLREEAAEES